MHVTTNIQCTSFIWSNHLIRTPPGSGNSYILTSLLPPPDLPPNLQKATWRVGFLGALLFQPCLGEVSLDCFFEKKTNPQKHPIVLNWVGCTMETCSTFIYSSVEAQRCFLNSAELLDQFSRVCRSQCLSSNSQSKTLCRRCSLTHQVQVLL